MKYEDPYLIFTLPRNDKSAAVGKFEGIKVEERKGYEFILQSTTPVSRLDYEKAMQIEPRTAQRQLKTLLEHGLIQSKGSGRSMKYEAIKD